MITATIHADRRRWLAEKVGGTLLFLGNGTRSQNLPMIPVPFRQDSNFLYLTGCTIPDAALVLDDFGSTLFLPKPADDDPLWHGPQPSFPELRESFAVDAIKPSDELESYLAGRTTKTLAIGDENQNRRAASWTDAPLRFGAHHGDEELVTRMIEMRRKKSEAELGEMRLAAAATAAAHKAVMRATHPGVPERSLAALFEAVLASRGLTTGYGTILTQAGEVLHSHNHDQRLSAGRLLLLDGGGEMASGYTSDVTRTWPVSKHFDPRQKAAYEAVLKAEEVAIALCKPGRPYREIHDAASHVIACFLADEGLVYGDPADIVEQGAHALFFPHGVGHLIGLDVHDLENFGDLPAYPPHTARPEAFGTCYLRLNLPIESNWVVTIEPGFYVVPAILRDAKLRERFRGLVNFEKAEKWIGFGGIRIEDDIVVGDEPENLSSSIPKTAEDLARIVGTGAPADALLS